MFRVLGESLVALRVEQSPGAGLSGEGAGLSGEFRNNWAFLLPDLGDQL